MVMCMVALQPQKELSARRLGKLLRSRALPANKSSIRRATHRADHLFVAETMKVLWQNFQCLVFAGGSLRKCAPTILTLEQPPDIGAPWAGVVRFNSYTIDLVPKHAFLLAVRDGNPQTSVVCTYNDRALEHGSGLARSQPFPIPTY